MKKISEKALRKHFNEFWNYPTDIDIFEDDLLPNEDSKWVQIELTFETTHMLTTAQCVFCALRQEFKWTDGVDFTWAVDADSKTGCGSIIIYLEDYELEA